jgi:hypothetical protein
MSYDEPETFNLHGVVFRSTAEQFRRLRARFVSLPVFLRWHRLDTLVRMHHVCSDNPLVFEEQSRTAAQLAEQYAEADRDVICALVELIEQELGN